MRLNAIKIPCYRLVANAAAREQLQTKGSAGLLDCSYSRDQISILNYPMELFIKLIDLTQPNNIIDATGIKGNIDITLHINLNAPRQLMLQHWRKALRANGLDLQEAEIEKLVLVTEDDHAAEW
ncbi:hypothetical protein [Deminuibacter soli]|uniref:Uncharacterized protein n=1 Tax=Deminuibacter soli TaxID=2291815 RepID=A0A3E1NPX0_9BACT|nr:hypothetical protein [Deminuibacter soli]RFM29972.1 hypothetical protein DXN05_03080 [Deminuibacter soli]